LKYIHKDLWQKLTQIQSPMRALSDRSDSNETFAKLRIKLTECLEIMKQDLNSNFSVEEPKHIADKIISELNGKLDQMGSAGEWLSQQLDELALSDIDQEVLRKAFNQQFCHNLDDIRKHLTALDRECQRIKEFYDINVREELSWRTDLNTILRHLQHSNDSQIIRVNSAHPKTHELAAKRTQTQEYHQLLKDVERQEFDEFRALIDALKDRIEVLTKN